MDNELAIALLGAVRLVATIVAVQCALLALIIVAVVTS